jgi:transcription-repair coupling factor (superfamily II helicase)
VFRAFAGNPADRALNMKESTIERLLDRFSAAETASRAVEACLSRDNNLVIINARGGAGATLAAAVHRQSNRPILFLTSTIERAEALADGLSFFGAAPLLFPPLETLPFENAEPVLHVAAARSRALAELAARSPGLSRSEEQKPSKGGTTTRSPIIVAPVDALIPKLLPAENLKTSRVVIRWGEQYDLDDLAMRLTDLGYNRETMVESPGEFSIRGTIVDVYPADADEPYRFDFLGDELESIRRFDPHTQRSLPIETEIEQVEILPRAVVAPAILHLMGGGQLISFFDLLPPDTLVFIEGPSRVAQRIEYSANVAARHWEEVNAPARNGEETNVFVENGIAPETWVMGDAEAKAALAQFQQIDLADLSLEAADRMPATGAPISIGAQSLESIPPNFQNFVELIRDKQLDRYLIAIVCDNAGQAQRLDELLIENQVTSVIVDAPEPRETLRPSLPVAIPPGMNDVTIMTGELHEGFIYPQGKILLLTDREIFGRYQRRRIYRKAYHGKVIGGPAEIQRGDFVVHMEHGIGQFEGIRRLFVDGRTAEFLEIVYLDNDKLLVPIEKLNLVQKYAGAEAKPPSLDRLGHKKWQKRRSKVEEQVRKLAGELLALYARREAAERAPYGPDSVWQQEFEASFVYQETPDQLKAIKEVKADMMNPRPADRLICGDVGYGKTEVAIRAAFKALSDGRQVAILCPTTILAQQHYQTFKERLAEYPFRVEVLSRFRSPAQQDETLEHLAAGEVHLVVGTHRLLSKDVKFHNLGLLVIDEEQRFGVKQKERIKDWKTAVDVLTLTATPIPRTLHMALSKLRDLSIIQTPPADRQPIKTRTIHFEKAQIEEAILRELNRGGQVYFVHNRIANIDEIARTIREIVPNARIAIGHGQMDEHQLEEIMIDFIAGRSDILISTTIIENGIDIPNVNTIIINRADMFGLAQLYQLRGRVGRDVRQAYAYLIVPRGHAITDSAMKRLAALEEFTELGMGFSIAMRDMEIRGTGNILGAEQSGAITDVGFDLYCRLLEEAVQEMRGGEAWEPIYQVDIKWPADQWLPETFIPVEAQRIRFYKDLASARDEDQLEMIREELLDRYGPIPAEGVNLLNAFCVKLRLAPWHVDTVQPFGKTAIRLSARERGRDLAVEIERIRGDAGWIDRIGFRSEGSVMIHLAEEMRDGAQLLDDLARLLENLPAPRRLSARTSAVPQTT